MVEQVTSPSDAQATAEEPEIFRIREGVGKVTRKTGTVLVLISDGRSLRISKVGDDLLPLLREGATFEELEAKLKRRYPGALDIGPKLRRFLQQMAETGLLDNAPRPEPKKKASQYPLFSPDPAAHAVARVIKRVPAVLSWTCLAALMLAAAAGVGALIYQGDLPHPRRLFDSFQPLGLALFAFVVIPVHEAAHALACRLAGAKVGKAGIIVHNYVMPGPYVDTTHAYLLDRRWRRFWIPAAGPVVNFLGMGAGAWALAHFGPETSAGLVSQTLFLLCAAFVILDTNPLVPSDGSRMIEAAIGDDLARRSALSTARAKLSGYKEVAIYRIATSMHVQGFAVLLYFWWTRIPMAGG